MTPLPKRRHSTMRKGKRRKNIKLQQVVGVACSHCGKKKLPHRICPSCGKK